MVHTYIKKCIKFSQNELSLGLIDAKFSIFYFHIILSSFEKLSNNISVIKGFFKLWQYDSGRI